jgi:glucose/arabinose dehydrogenase
MRPLPGSHAAAPALPLLATLAVLGCNDDALVDVLPAGSLELVTDDLDAPLHLTAPPGDTERLFVVERAGRIRIVRNEVLLPTPFLDIASLTSAGGERGLLSLAFHPSYDANGHFYVNYTDTGGDTRVVRYTVSASDPDLADPGSAELILTVAQPFPNHNGGQIAFGPDGMLYIGMGDGGSGGDPLGHGQNPETLLGSLLRIDVDAGSPYAIPPDNPFADHPTIAPEMWAYGLRNPWRFSFDRATGDLYLGDVGQNAIEEISYQHSSSAGGENYGWNVTEGTACFDPPSGCATSGLTPPIYEYDHAEGCSVTGGFVYRGTAQPALDGRYFFADFCSSWIRSFTVLGGAALDLIDHSDELGPVDQISSFGEDGAGELYVVSLSGSVYRIASP